MLNKDYANQAPEAIGGPVIRSYIPRTSAKRVPGAILNYALSPNEPKNGLEWNILYFSSPSLTVF